MSEATRSGRSATAESAESIQQSPTPPCRMSAAAKPPLPASLKRGGTNAATHQRINTWEKPINASTHGKSRSAIPTPTHSAAAPRAHAAQTTLLKRGGEAGARTAPLEARRRLRGPERVGPLEERARLGLRLAKRRARGPPARVALAAPEEAAPLVRPVLVHSQHPRLRPTAALWNGPPPATLIRPGSPPLPAVHGARLGGKRAVAPAVEPARGALRSAQQCERVAPARPRGQRGGREPGLVAPRGPCALGRGRCLIEVRPREHERLVRSKQRGRLALQRRS
jgi:hypothetical protein